MSETVRSTIEDGLARITIARPPLNILTNAMLRELAEAFESASRNDAVRLIRLDAEGKLFCAGVDVGDHVGEALPEMIGGLSKLFDTMAHVEVPTVSVVHGAALGGGCELILGTDLCLASERASFGQPEIRLGLFAPPASVLLPRLVGERRAMGMLLSGAAISATEARGIGLVNEVFPDDVFDEQVDAWLAGLLQLSGVAMRLAKRAVREARSGEVGDAHRRVNRLYLEELMATADAQEGLGAFMNKRRPVWTHR